MGLGAVTGRTRRPLRTSETSARLPSTFCSELPSMVSKGWGQKPWALPSTSAKSYTCQVAVHGGPRRGRRYWGAVNCNEGWAELQARDPCAAPQSHTKPSVWEGAGQTCASVNKVFPKRLARAADSHKEPIFCSRPGTQGRKWHGAPGVPFERHHEIRPRFQ